MRTNLKIAGAVMVLIGALVAWQAYGEISQVTHAYSDDEVRSFADLPGGNLTLLFAGASAANPARMAVTDYNGTALGNTTTDTAGIATLQVPKAAVRVQATWGNSTWSRKALTTPHYTTTIRLDAAAPQTATAWAMPDLDVGTVVGIAWGVVAIGAVLIVTGVFAFRLRAPRLAMAGAVVFLLAGLALALLVLGAAGPNLGALVQPLLFVAMGGFCVWSVRQGWSRFQPLRVAGLEL